MVSAEPSSNNSASKPILTTLQRKPHTIMTSLTSGSPNNTYIVYGTDRWTGKPTTWVDLPGAKIPLSIGNGATSFGAVFVATFSTEVLAEATDNNGVVYATVFFGDQQAEPSSDNHRYSTARGGSEWSSHTFIRVIQFNTAFDFRDVTAQVKIRGSASITQAGIQNWVLKIERFNC